MKWLISPEDYPLPNPRIDGWRKLREVKARTVDIFVLPLEVFDLYRKKGSFPKDFEEELGNKAKEIIEKSPSHTAIIRRAFVVPGLENPPGPRFLGLKTKEEVVNAVCELYSFAIKQGYAKDPKSQISGWLEPPSLILDIEKFKENPQSTMIPYGGYAISENGITEIYAVFGINEGVQSLVADRYVLEIRRGKYYVIRKEIPQKNLMLCTTLSTQSQRFFVPVEMQFDQVLSDSEIPEVARVVYELSQKYGPQRVEFSTDEGGICFNEVADYYKKQPMATQVNTKVIGETLSITGVADLDKLTKLTRDELNSGQKMILVDENVILKRNYDVLGALASWKDNLYVLYPGVAATQHAMRILADKGHRAFLIGSQKFEEGDKVQIVTTGGKVRITNLSKTEDQKVITLWDASLFGTELCGGKAYRLSQLKTFGFQVPHGSVCTTVLFDEVLKILGVDKLTLENFPKIEKKISIDNKRVKFVVDDLLPEYRKQNKVFSIRSSATLEDSYKHSLAGIFESFLNVDPGKLSENIIKVIRSTFSKRAVEYLSHHKDLVKNLKMAVVVQDMIKAKVAGVIFGAKVQTKDHNIVEIEASTGLGEALVSGKAKVVEYYSFNRQERRIVERKGPELLTQPEVKALFMLSERLRSEFSDIPQDIEWAIDKGGQIWVLQSRDLFVS
ncbi:hypothetical protein A2961_00455 [Candidatus Woesebacteria bacterium RIFCSPLOWO2_01_FULL_39_21]|uniref:Phosphoenolpyruvate synthase n=1 Tax=Candidatus Woesebacteria bacterium RIFCSPLOWO2_01_FULL_39_21 TaxID=1802519 RepID=A0A1F8BCT7_9BACT|nr:MAG: hypothetical protein A2691_00375 [Candidatus Woesebacteria bacterium RIFCSPHIGHO2_01_FULL_39_23]OGM61175.1 MAG: hypothetical protein A2961_00455 [Candidatus Woesebacteria bacterium RIFCSPLOWO2_01_FULL_39_21]